LFKGWHRQSRQQPILNASTETVFHLYQFGALQGTEGVSSLLPAASSISTVAAPVSTSTAADIAATDNPFVMSDAEQLDLAMMASLADIGDDGRSVAGFGKIDGMAQVPATPEKAHVLKTAVRAKVTRELQLLVTKEEDSPSATELDVMFSLQERFRAERYSLSPDCEDLVRNGSLADEAYHYLRNKERYMLKRKMGN